MATPLHSLPLTGAPLDHIAEDNPQRAHYDPDIEKGIARLLLSTHRAPINKSSPLLWMFSKRELHNRETVAKRAQARRVKVNK